MPLHNLVGQEEQAGATGQDYSEGSPFPQSSVSANQLSAHFLGESPAICKVLEPGHCGIFHEILLSVLPLMYL